MNIIAKTFFVTTVLIVIAPFVRANDEIAVSKTDIADKYYRQALFHYFQGDAPRALVEVSRAELRLGELNNPSQLFKAGLQVSMGMQSQAQQSLLDFDGYQSVNEEKSSNAQELLQVALLSLTEQYLEQGKRNKAQEILSSISQISPQYYSQYSMLSQLAYWPNQPILLPISQHSPKANNTIEDDIFTPYIQLNNALRYIDQGEEHQAIKLLKQIKQHTWFAKEATFWQKLFSTNLFSFNNDPVYIKQNKSQVNQSNAINDYARILLAQVYIKQNDFEQAFYELKGFPQQSVYSEFSLYLFALSAQETKHFTRALNLLNLLHEKYPYSHLGWQAGELLSKQITEQQSLEQGLYSYQQLEAFFQKRISDLLTFEQSHTLNVKSVGSVWLSKAVKDPLLSHLYQKLEEVDALINQLKGLQNNNEWLAETISLNQQKKRAILTSNQNVSEQKLLANFYRKRDQIAEKINAASPTTSVDSSQVQFDIAKPFANEEERQWLERIKQAKSNLRYIEEHAELDNSQGDIAEYKARLTRIEKVLNWQLHQAYPVRHWSHTQQLSQLDKLLTEVEIQQDIILTLNESSRSLSGLIKRQVKAESTNKALLAKATHLRETINQQLSLKLTAFVKDQHETLSQYSLNVKRAMANIVEQMIANDAKVEQQLLIQKEKATSKQSNIELEVIQ